MNSMVLNFILGDCTIELTIHVEPLWCIPSSKCGTKGHIVLSRSFKPSPSTNLQSSTPKAHKTLNQCAFGSNLLHKCGQTWAARPKFSSFFQTTDYLATDWVMLGTSRTEVPWLKQVSFLIVGRWNPYLMTRHGTKYVVEYHEQLIFVEFPHAYKVIKSHRCMFQKIHISLSLWKNTFFTWLTPTPFAFPWKTLKNDQVLMILGFPLAASIICMYPIIPIRVVGFMSHFAIKTCHQY